MRITKNSPTIVYVDDIEGLAQRESYKKYIAEQIASEFRGTIQGEVIKLSSLQREAILKFFWEDCSIDEIARQMKLTQKSVKKLLDMGLNSIKQRLVLTGLGKDLSPA